MLSISCSLLKQGRIASLTCASVRNFWDNSHRSLSVTADVRERLKSVSYNQSAIDLAAAKKSGRLKPSTILYSGKSSSDSHILRTAEYLQRELPIRIAHRIVAIQGLPYNVVINPIILQVLEMYVNAFELLIEFPTIRNMDDEAKYAELLRSLLDQHSNVITMLAEGFSECRKHIKDEETIRLFLDRTLKSRLGIRILCEHHLALRTAKPNHVGIFKLNFSPGPFIEKRGEIVRTICEDKFGRAPQVKLEGHVNAMFPYIPPPLDYILVELLKNAMRSTVEYHIDSLSENLPQVKVTIANNDVDFIIRISDRGGGVPHHILKKIWDYNFTTDGVSSDSRVANRGLFAEFVDPRSSGGEAPSKMHGYGFGLPMSRAYAEFLGGTLTMETMQGRGTEVYLRLRHIEDKHESFRI